ncbi:hypothetical protein SLEP1_g14223 [Rubroshorea leprosula]|uniref:DUF4220 domain-containing protein n=1 Tax=Rubroshorea leprosula TaxID=152421 RepID=A0AAV5IR96_9ROSI|nr:hypothetical protein SLEP1_g14223 [Rubroshorea leprosula]
MESCNELDMSLPSNVIYFIEVMKDVRVILLLSLSLQVFLVLVAPLRKFTGKKFLLLTIWSVYMLAQWTATFGITLIINQNVGGEGFYVTIAALSCWASFLLLHLSYTNNITAFALETKEWLSHMYRLIFQFVATLFVLVLLFSGPSCPLFSSIPAILVFIAAVIKNAERTSALYLASQDRFKKPKEENQHHTTVEIGMKTGGVLDDLEVIQYAYYSYKICRGLVFDQNYNFREQTQIRELFSSVEAENALRLIEVEVNFFSEVLQTKSEFVHSVKGYVCRFLAFVLVATAFVCFESTRKSFKLDSYSNFDLGVTYSLFLWAIFQEVIAFIMVVFSDWTVAALMPDVRLREKNSSISKVKRLVYSILCYFLVLKRPLWYPCECEIKHEHEVLATPILLRRWSGSISTYNLMGYCLKCCPTRIHYHKRDCFSILINKIIHLSGSVINFLSLALLFEAAADIIKKASKYMGKYKAFSWSGVIIARGIWWFWSLIIKCLCFIVRKIFQFLLLKNLLDEMRYVSREPLTKDLWKFIFLELKDKSKYADNPRTIRQLCTARGDWVLKDGAWESCSRALIPFLADVSYDHSLLLWHIATELCYNTNTNEVNNESADECGFCSNNYREFKRFFTENGLGPKQLKRACEQILSIKTNNVNKVTSQSVLFDAVNLANKLKTLQQENGVDIWKLLSKVWMEMLACAAYHCSSHEHAQQLSRGGELISFVGILMAHFGLGGRFQDMRIQSENV